jgi:hypothetical protein
MTDEIDVFAQLDRSATELLALISKMEVRIKRQNESIASYTKYMNSSDVRTAAFGAVLANDSIDAEARQFLITAATDALQRVPEFNHPIYSVDLLNACSDNRSITISLAENKVVVTINLNETAGNIEEYAAAVAAARKVLDANKAESNKFGGKNITSGKLASKMWFEKIYSVDRLGKSNVPRKRYNRSTKEYEIINVADKYQGKYLETMALRKSYYMSGHPAPWWYLLEHGNTKVAAFKERGGTAKPSNAGQYFVRTAKTNIENFLYGKIQIETSEIRQSCERKIAKRQTFITTLQEKLDVLQKELENTDAFVATKTELTRYLEEKGLEHLTTDRKFEQAIQEIYQFKGSVRHGFRFASGERHRLVTVYRRTQAAMAGG